MRISPDTARRVVSCIDEYGTANRAAGIVSAQLRAIAPYRDRRLARILHVLNEITVWSPDARARNLRKLRAIADH